MHLGDGGKVGVGKGVGAGAGPVEDRAPDLDVAIHLGEHPAHSLHRADRAAKGLAVAGIAQSLAESTLRQSDPDRGIHATLGFEGGQQLAEAVLAADPVAQRTLSLIELYTRMVTT